MGWIRDFSLEDRCLLSGIVMPSDTVSSDIGVSGVLYDGVTGQYVKQITITNNSTAQTIYPFLEDANSRTAISGDPSSRPNYTGTGMFDPFDAVNQEYRGYIGYTQQVNGQTVNYVGLLPGNSITIDVPLVFWDAGRIIITTDGADLFGTGANGNPFLYRDQRHPGDLLRLRERQHPHLHARFTTPSPTTAPTTTMSLPRQNGRRPRI